MVLELVGSEDGLVLGSSQLGWSSCDRASNLHSTPRKETAPEGSWRLRVEALESMIEAQVP